MKILMTRLDDLRNELYETEPSWNQNAEEYKSYQQAQKNAETAFNALLQDCITSLGLQSLTATAYITELNYSRVGIDFNCTDNANTLKWRYSIYYDILSKTVKSESTAWSDLDIAKPDAVNQLRECADLVEYLKNEDWNRICEEICSQFPDITDYVTSYPKGRKPINIKRDIYTEELCESIRQNMNVPVQEINSYGRQRDIIYVFIKETPKKFLFYDLGPRATLENYKDIMKQETPHYISKDNLINYFSMNSKFVPAK